MRMWHFCGFGFINTQDDLVLLNHERFDPDFNIYLIGPRFRERAVRRVVTGYDLQVEARVVSSLVAFAISLEVLFDLLFSKKLADDQLRSFCGVKTLLYLRSA